MTRKGTTHRRWTTEDRTEALLLVEQGVPMKEVGVRLGVSPATLGGWITKERPAISSPPLPKDLTHLAVSSLEGEVRKLSERLLTIASDLGSLAERLGVLGEFELLLQRAQEVVNEVRLIKDQAAALERAGIRRAVAVYSEDSLNSR